jgi:predicted nucleic acid-binding protein
MKHLDTSVAIDHLRRKPEATLLLDSIFEQGEDVAASELVRFEVLAGAREGELDETERFLSLLDWLHVDQDVARVGAALASMYRSAHSGIGDVDYLIAATALEHDADLLTTNVRHFPMLAGLAPAY